MTKTKFLGGVGTAAAVLALAAPAAAATPKNHLYWFQGKVAVTPAAGASQLAVNVSMADRAANRFINRHGSTLNFTVDASTSYVAVTAAPSGRGNVPNPSSQAMLHAGDSVSVAVWAPAKTKVRDLLATPAQKVTDYATAAKVTGFNYGFTGKLISVDQAANKLTMWVQSADRPWGTTRQIGRRVVFTIDPSTLFLNWDHKIPSLLLPSDLPARSKITIHLRAPRGTKLNALLTQPLWRVAHFGPLPASTTS